mmetsp:Transcript_25436/g.83680  ORF Transcript_25436/g.83680 Transcript_25436/m.83680 type:complete len:585 (+) Transcript_25436:3-1757(+)
MGAGCSCFVSAAEQDALDLANVSGVLKITIEGCEGVPAKYQPFILVSCGPITFRTHVWSEKDSEVETSAFLITKEMAASHSLKIKFSIFDKELFRSNEKLCTGLVDVPQVGQDISSTTELMQGLANGCDKCSIKYSATLMSMASVEKEFWEHWFAAFDAPSSGPGLDFGEFDELVKHVSPNHADLTEQKMQSFFQGADADGDGRVDSEELATFMAAPEQGCLVNKDQLMDYMRETLKINDDARNAGFLVESQAAKGWIFGLSEWQAPSYDVGINVGRNAKHILIYERETGGMREEVIDPHINMAMRAMYQSPVGLAMLSVNSSKQLLKKMSIQYGVRYNSPKSVSAIKPFIEHFHLNMEEALEKVEDYKTFNEFFYRRLKPESRPIAAPKDPTVCVSAADCRLMVFPHVDEITKLWVKGKKFSLGALLGSEEDAKKFVGGSCAIFRLAPQDYHRFHVPVKCRVGKPRPIAGEYYTVNPVAINSTVDVLTTNKRSVTMLESEEFGTVAFVAVGATNVATISYVAEEGAELDKGAEYGYFAFGGSTCVCLWEPGKIQFDADLLNHAAKSTESLIKMGMTLGKAPTK